MKLRIETDPSLPEPEVVIRCPAITETITHWQRLILETGAAEQRVAFFRGDEEFFLPPDEICFFETESELVYGHTAKDAFRTRRRLYELEELLPRYFIRGSKSMILNTRRICGIKRDLSSASLVSFTGTHKQVYVSRRYFPLLREILADGKKGL